MRLLESNSKRSIIFIAIILALITLAPRVSSLRSDWTSGDEDRWIGRSFRFLTALHRGDFHETLLADHPGVTTMWAGAGTLWLKYRRLLFMFDDGKKQSDNEQALSLISVENLARTRLGIAILTTITILIGFFFLRKLLGLKIAIVATLLIAFDPTYLMETRRIHVDAPMTGFILLTILSLIIYMESPRKRRYLLFSGLSFGLACLSKTPSMILFFYLPLLFALYYGVQVSDFNSHGRRDPAELLYSLIVWTGAACLTFVGLWPALWIAEIRLGGVALPLLITAIPLLIVITTWSFTRLAYPPSKNSSSVDSTSEGRRQLAVTLLSLAGVCLVLVAVLMNAGRLVPEIRNALATPHDFPQIFLGNVVYDPGVFYYPIMLTIYATPLVLLGSVVGILIVWVRRNQIQNSKALRTVLSLLIFVVLYIVCMSLGAKKLSRYILPVYPILDIIAAISLCTLIEGFHQYLLSSSAKIRFDSALGKLAKAIVSYLILPGILLYQISSTISIHPRYGSYFNPLWPIQSIKKATIMGRGVGIGEAANYLNQINEEGNMVLRASSIGSTTLWHYFNGRVQPLDALRANNSDVYDFIYFHDVQLGIVDEKRYSGRVPEHTVSVNNIDYVKIYKIN